MQYGRRVVARVKLQQIIRAHVRRLMEVLARPVDGGKDVGHDEEAGDAAGLADDAGALAADLRRSPSGLSSLACSHSLTNTPSVRKIDCGSPSTMFQAFPSRSVWADSHDAAILKTAAGEPHFADGDQVRLGAADAGHGADLVDPAAGDIAGQIDVVDAPMAHPNVGLAVVHQHARLADQAHEQPPLDAHQDDGKHHADQGSGRACRDRRPGFSGQCSTCKTNRLLLAGGQCGSRR